MTPEQCFGARMREARRARGMTQGALAARLSWAQTDVSRSETGGRGIRLNDAVAVSALLGVPLERMLSADPVKVELA